MKTITSRPAGKGKARLVPAGTSTGLLPAGVLVVLLGMSSAARATDYLIQGTCAGYSTSGHAAVDYSPSARTGSVSVWGCAGATGCCCLDDCPACDPVDEQGQECCPQHCADCCHDATEHNGHQSCCSTDGSPDVCCREDAAACTAEITRATVRKSSSCTQQGQIVATLCDNNDPGNLCPPAGQRLEAVLTVGTGPGDDLTEDDLWDMHGGLLSIYVEFTGGATLSADITNDGPKDNPLLTVPALSHWGLTALAGLLAIAGILSIRQRRPKPA